MYNFQASDSRQDVAREKAAYEKLLAKYDALNFAADEGIFKITVHSESGMIEVPVAFNDGRNIATTLLELHGAWVKQVEAYLNYSLVGLGQEAESEANRIALKEEARAERLQGNLAEVERINYVTAGALQQQTAVPLAQQAAAAPVQRPAPRKAGRPRKEVAEALGQAAALVPMNGAGKQPGSVATNLPH